MSDNTYNSFGINTKNSFNTKPKNTMQTQLRTISAIARDIRADWKKVNYAAKPYLEAMLSINYNGDTYGYDAAESIVRYFLCNASTYRGENAKALKAELKTVCGFTK